MIDCGVIVAHAWFNQKPFTPFRDGVMRGFALDDLCFSMSDVIQNLFRHSNEFAFGKQSVIMNGF